MNDANQFSFEDRDFFRKRRNGLRSEAARRAKSPLISIFIPPLQYTRLWNNTSVRCTPKMAFDREAEKQWATTFAGEGVLLAPLAGRN